MTQTAVILMAFGGPESLAEVEPFMHRLTGRPLPPPAIERVIERYKLIGGASPLPDIARRQAAALRHLLANESAPEVRAAFRYSEPSITRTVQELAAAGYRRIVGVSLSAHFTQISAGAYDEALRVAGEEHGIETVVADLYYAEPHFLDCLAAYAKQAVESLPHPNEAVLVFSAHSLPMEQVERGDPYVAQLRSTVDGLLTRVPGYEWRLAYQSRGLAQVRWLEPTVESALETLASEGRQQVALIPIGFTADHMETLYDIDIVIAGKARELGFSFARSAVPNADDLFIEALATVVRPHLE